MTETAPAKKVNVFDRDYKDGAFRLQACFCTDQSLVTACPCFLLSGKYCCMELIVQGTCDGKCVSCTCGRPCCDQEQGLCEAKQKCCCCYAESQCPPSADIGMACCGIVCVGQKEKTVQARSADAPEQAYMNMD